MKLLDQVVPPAGGQSINFAICCSLCILVFLDC